MCGDSTKIPKACEYNERKEEIDIMLKRIEKGEETWINEHSDEETLGVVNIRKQPKK